MENENKNPTGAPSEDTTSALFVSARKKQIEQQEAERKAREKEEKRLAAEAEVQRLEREVAQRRLKAEEDAKRAEAEAAEEARRIAEEARARKAKAAENPDAILGPRHEKKEFKLPQIPKIARSAETPEAGASGDGAAAKTPLNTKMLALVGGGVLVLILAVVLIFTLGGNKAVVLDQRYLNSSKGFDLLYPTGWLINDDVDNAVVLTSEDLNGTLTIFDVTNVIEMAMSQGYDITSATEYIYDTYTAGLFDIDQALVPTPELQKNGDYVVGVMEFEVAGYALTFNIEALENRMIAFASQVPVENEAAFDAIAADISFSLTVNARSDAPADGPAGTTLGGEDGEPWDVDPEAPLDGTLVMPSLNFGLSYPSEIFYVSSNGDNFIELATYDPNGALLSVQKADVEVETTDGLLYSDAIAPQLNEIGQRLLAVYFGGQDNYTLQYEEALSADAPAGTPLRYTAGASFTMNGREMAGLLVVSVWTIEQGGAPTGEHAYYFELMYYNLEEQISYEALFWRMHNATYDA